MSSSVPRLALATLVADALAFATLGAAATLGGVDAPGLSSGRSAVASCDSNGVTTSFTVTAGNVQSATVSDVAAGCATGSLNLVLTNASGTAIASGGPATVNSTSVIVTLSPQPAAADVAGTHISITGP